MSYFKEYKSLFRMAYTDVDIKDSFVTEVDAGNRELIGDRIFKMEEIINKYGRMYVHQQCSPIQEEFCPGWHNYVEVINGVEKPYFGEINAVQSEGKYDAIYEWPPIPVITSSPVPDEIIIGSSEIFNYNSIINEQFDWTYMTLRHYNKWGKYEDVFRTSLVEHNIPGKQHFYNYWFARDVGLIQILHKKEHKDRAILIWRVV